MVSLIREVKYNNTNATANNDSNNSKVIVDSVVGSMDWELGRATKQDQALTCLK